jgi:hypothetical protein
MHPIPPYGVAIQEAIQSGDVSRMQQVAKDAEEYLRHADEVRAALGQLHEHIKRTRNS